MNTKAETGREGERLAADYLKRKGYTIVEKNYRFKRSEIDIIAVCEGRLVFVEVKTRSSTAFGHPEIAVNEKKIAKIMQGAEQYIYENTWEGNVRFDVISVIKKSHRTEIEHFEDAFY